MAYKITVANSITGWMAVLITNEDGYWEPYQTGVGKYATREEAIEEAQSWSISDEIPLDPYLFGDRSTG